MNLYSAAATMALLLVTSNALAGNITVDNATLRATAPGVPVSAAYMTLENHDDTERVLLTAHTDLAASVELHSHVMDGGMMKMRRLDSIPIPAGGRVTFEPGGLHIMLIGLKQALNAGDHKEIELEFDDSTRINVSFEVIAPGS
jgi:periplasmic copper chaperone A